MKTKKLFTDPNKCRGCLTCEIMCSFFHECLFSPERARIHIVKDDEAGVEAPVVCRQCIKPSCLAACPEKAISQDPISGVVSIDETRCSGCGECMEACPYGAMALHPDTGIAIICDLCGGNPECVLHCPFDAILFAEPAEMNTLKRERLRQNIIERVKLREEQTEW